MIDPRTFKLPDAPGTVSGNELKDVLNKIFKDAAEGNGIKDED